MILTLRDVRDLPLPAALVDVRGAIVAHSPEWSGGGPGTIAYGTESGTLLLSPSAHRPELEALTGELVRAVRDAGRAAPSTAVAAAVRVLADGLSLVAGRPPQDAGTSDDVRELAGVALARRTRLRVSWETPSEPVSVRSPGVVALALVQLASNAERYMAAAEVEIAVSAGPTFWVRWPAATAAGAPVTTHRHPALRRRWGLGFVRQAVDALGGSHSGPQDLGPDRVGAHVGLGTPTLTLPLAVFEGGARTRSTRAWDEEAGLGVRRLAGRSRAPGRGGPGGPAGDLAAVLREAAQRPGEIVQREHYRARHAGGRTLVALAPQSTAARAVDALRGFEHEELLWSAPEPHASRVHALMALLQPALGRPWPMGNPLTWRDDLRAAGLTFGVELDVSLRGLTTPDPRALAYLLARMGGSLRELGEAVLYRPDPARVDPALAAALGIDAAGHIRIA